MVRARKRVNAMSFVYRDKYWWGINQQMEICVDSIESARNAIAGGADRLEVCSALSEGGLTPTPGLMKFIGAIDGGAGGTIKIYAMIRLRSGNFVYSREEMNAMLYDLEILKNAREQRVDGFVFGALREDGSIDSEYCREIIMAARPKPVTFHRAFDQAVYPLKSIESIIDLGFERILTSGQRETAIEGIELVKKLIDRANDRIVIMPGSGINPTNIEAIKRGTGAREFHASAAIKEPLDDEISRSADTLAIGLIDRRSDHRRHRRRRRHDPPITSQQLVKQMVAVVKNNPMENYTR